MSASETIAAALAFLVPAIFAMLSVRDADPMQPACPAYLMILWGGCLCVTMRVRFIATAGTGPQRHPHR